MKYRVVGFFSDYIDTYIVKHRKSNRAIMRKAEKRVQGPVATYTLLEFILIKNFI